MNLERGQVFGAYTILEPIGQGGFATAYKARHPGLNRIAALKILHDTDGDKLPRFRREARILARLSHPHIVEVFDFGVTDGTPWLALAFMEGGSVKGATRRAYPPDRALEMGIQIARGVEALHEAGIIHRDLKTDNVLLDDRGRCKITDFGLARSEDATLLTRQGAVMGTLLYAAPESLMNGTFDPRSDLYAVGLVLYELFTGQVPFRAETIQEFARLVLAAPPPPIPALPVPWHPQLQDLLDRTLAKNPADRPADVAALRRELEALQRSAPLPPDDGSRATLDAETVPRTAPGTAPRTAPGTAPGTGASTSRSRPGILLVLVALIGGLLWGFRGANTPGPRVDPADAAPLATRPVALADRPPRFVDTFRTVEDPDLAGLDQARSELAERLAERAVQDGIETGLAHRRDPAGETPSILEVLWSHPARPDVTPRATRDGEPLALASREASPDEAAASPTAGWRLHLAPGRMYTIQVGDRTVSFRTPFRRPTLPDFDVSPTGVLFRVPASDLRFAHRIWDLRRRAPVTAPPRSHQDAPALRVWQGGLEPGRAYRLDIVHGDHPDLAFISLEFTTPSPEAFHEEFKTQLLDPLASYLRREEDHAVQLTAGLRQLNDRERGRQTGAVQSMAFHLGRSFKLYPSPRSRGELLRILGDRIADDALEPHQKRELRLGSYLAMSFLGMVEHRDKVAGELEKSPPPREAMQLILALGIAGDPRALPHLARYRDRTWESRGERAWWTDLWLDIDPSGAREALARRTRGADSGIARDLLLELALRIPTPTTVSYLETIDPASVARPLRLELAAHLAGILDPRAPVLARSWTGP